MGYKEDLSLVIKEQVKFKWKYEILNVQFFSSHKVIEWKLRTD